MEMGDWESGRVTTGSRCVSPAQLETRPRRHFDHVDCRALAFFINLGSMSINVGRGLKVDCTPFPQQLTIEFVCQNISE